MNFLITIQDWFVSAGQWFINGLYKTFIEADRYKLFLTGLANTLIIAFTSVIIGLVIGVLIGSIRVLHVQSGKLKILDKFFGLYITVFRGTPIVVQLLIWYFLVLRSVENGVIVAIISFGLNSGAYVAEIVRGGILSIDHGQTEAGRSLGLSTWQTMQHIVLPQAIKNILPALGNEFIALLKETSVVGYITVIDLTRASDKVKSTTYDPFFPFLSVAIIYLLMVIIISKLLGRLERRLRVSDKR